MPDGPAPSPLWRKLLWFLALWGGGVASVTAVSVLLRAWIAPE